jgi:muramoyltetrapeptide carboxypeptidase
MLEIMTIRYPAPLQPGDRIGITAPSTGVWPGEEERLERALAAVRGRGYKIALGDCLHGTTHVSAPVADRAAELTAMLTDPEIRAIIPPRGGETAVDLLSRLDWAAIAAAEPTWFIGFSDISTLLLPMTLATGIATLHATTLMITPYTVTRPLLTWLDVAALPAGSTFVQGETTRPWIRLDRAGPVEVTGRLIGGCIDTVGWLAGTPAGDVARFGDEYAEDGLIVYVEAAGADAYAVCRALHGMRLGGFFDHARAILVGATEAPSTLTMTQEQAVLDALGDCGVPIISGAGCGHIPPYLAVVNGARGRLSFGQGAATLTQTLG